VHAQSDAPEQHEASEHQPHAQHVAGDAQRKLKQRRGQRERTVEEAQLHFVQVPLLDQLGLNDREGIAVQIQEPRRAARQAKDGPADVRRFLVTVLHAKLAMMLCARQQSIL
jgi:hypothetical protein